MADLCEGLNTLSREEAQRIYDERLRMRERVASDANRTFVRTAIGFDGGAGSDWMDQMTHQDWEDYLGGPEESWFEGHYS